jgi:hypothetical protein
LLAGYVAGTNSMLALRVKTVGKIPENFGSIFPYFSVISYYSLNMVIGTKTGYGVAGIYQNTIGLPYRPFSDSPKNPDLFRISYIVHLGFPVLFIWAESAIFFSFNPMIF